MSSKDPNGEIPLKLILFGDSGTGKSSVFLQYITGKFEEDLQPSIGSCPLNKHIAIGDVRLNLTIYDNSGQERFIALQPLLIYRGSHIAFVFFDVTQRKTFESFSKWFELVQSVDNSGNILFVAVGTKTDLADKRGVSTEEARDYFTKMNPRVLYFEVCAKTGEGINDLFERSVECWIHTRSSLAINENVKDDDDQKKECNEDKCIIF